MNRMLSFVLILGMIVLMLSVVLPDSIAAEPTLQLDSTARSASVATPSTPPVVIYEDFEDGYDLTWWDFGEGVFTWDIKDDQAHGGIYSLRVDYAKTGTYQFIGAEIEAGTSRRDFSQHVTVVLWVYGKVDMLLKFEDSSGHGEDVGIQSATNPNGWSKLEYDYSHLADQMDLTDVKNFLFFPAPGDPAASGTFYLDDIQIVRTPSTPMPTSTSITSSTPTPTATPSSSPSATPTPTDTPSPTSSWTAMVYLNGDNNLAGWIEDAFQKLEIVAGAPNVRIVALWDRRGDGNTARFLVQHDDNLFELADYREGVNRWSTWDECDEDEGRECNMADAQTLYNFVTWARSTFPAEHNFLSIVDHGGGWGPTLDPGQHDYAFLGGMSWDDTSGGPPISTKRMGQAFRQFTNDGADKIDVVLYDACSMATIEDAYEIHRYADYLVASQNETWSVFAYDRYLEGLDTITDPRELAENIVTRYIDSLAGYPRTMSAIDLAALNPSDGLAKRVNDLGTALRPLASDDKGSMEQARVEAQKFDANFDEILGNDDYYVDLYDFADELRKRFPNQPDVQNVTEDVKRLARQAVIAERHISAFNSRNGEFWDLEEANGISIYVPSPVLESRWLVPLYNPDNLAFARDTSWDEWVREFRREGGGPTPTPIPPGEQPGPLPLPRTYLPLIVKSDID